jgi:acyl-CoA thioesterase YciA
MTEAHRIPAIRVTLLPKDTNWHGTIFGGVLLSQIDLAAAIETRKHTTHRTVTVAMQEVEFKKPVFVGDVVSFYTSLVRRGKTSLTIHVDVEASRHDNPDHVVQVTQAVVIFVTVDAAGNKCSVD